MADKEKMVDRIKQALSVLNRAQLEALCINLVIELPDDRLRRFYDALIGNDS